ncbi:MAG: hypothetical protein QM621_04995 [Aeromicrobium sp.]|uniref:hypothetical protein n=1 Tax=Aeromicrobium sp. TaxID=1871063 RepID=UPI0039E39079
MLRKAGAGLLAVVGVVTAVLGVGVMVVLGPDGRFTTGPHPIDTDTSALVTTPGVVKHTGVQLDVKVEVPIDKPVFVGVGNSIDVENYVADTERLEVVSYETPWKVSTTEVEGQPNLPSAPTALDWWLAGQAGLGGATISLPLPDEPVSVAVLSVGSTNLTGLEVTIAYGVKGGFGRGLGLALIGVGLCWGALLAWRDRLWREDEFAWTDVRDDEAEEVFVYIDEDGVEHEVDPADLDGYELVEEEVQPPPDPDEGTEESGDEEPVVYVFVDEDGVEREVDASELDDYEIADEEDQR